MSPSTRRLCEALIRLAKGAVGVCEVWLKEQPIEHERPITTQHDRSASV